MVNAGRKPLLAVRDIIAYIPPMKRNILLHPDPRLKKVATPVADLSDDLRLLADDMLQTMYEAPGIGLAAPQIGIMDRLIVLDCVKEEGETPRPMVMFNPKVLASSDEENTYEEGCLSLPDLYADVTRPKVVDVEWMDRDGKLQTDTFDGLWATCVQHEIDHLDGKLFIDYLKPLKRQMMTRKMVKLKRELARA
ncbi:Peptide deformylase [Sulfitobacter noctilucicola]|nr:Peptide deformylase [Sulfitobacter noctilucicola]